LADTNPGATSFTIPGDRKMPPITMNNNRTLNNINADRARIKASVRPLRTIYWVKTGIKAELNDPSAKSRRSRFGILKAAMKASELKPAPKYQAMTASRIKPRIRLKRVAVPTTPAAFTTREFSDITTSRNSVRQIRKVKPTATSGFGNQLFDKKMLNYLDSS